MPVAKSWPDFDLEDKAPLWKAILMTPLTLPLLFLIIIVGLMMDVVSGVYWHFHGDDEWELWP